LDLKLLNRLITTFDEVPPFYANQNLAVSTDMPSTIHIADNDGVTFVSKRVPPKSFVRPQSLNTTLRRMLQNRDPQGLRRPRFSFFI